jgi:hypothetical protein
MSGKLVPQIRQRDVRPPLKETQDHSGMRFDPRRAPVSTLRLGKGIPNLPRMCMPADGA